MTMAATFGVWIWRMRLLMLVLHVAAAEAAETGRGSLPSSSPSPSPPPIGMNWGTHCSHPLSPSPTMLRLLQANGVSRLKLLDASSSTAMLNALAGSSTEVMLGLPNELLLQITYLPQAKAWVRDNVVRYMYTGGVNIKYVAVGNEPFLQSYHGAYLDVAYTALVNIQTALNEAKLGERVKATIPVNVEDAIEAGTSSGLPSGSAFRADLRGPMSQIVSWLSQNGAPFTANISPFMSLYHHKRFPTDYAFFDGSQNPLVDGPYIYHNIFDATYDSLLVAMEALPAPSSSSSSSSPSSSLSASSSSSSSALYYDVDIIVGEIGWPTDGDVNANAYYARKFNQGFLDHVAQGKGTPRRPNAAIHFYMLSLIDEDMKPIERGNFERHWGVLSYDGKPKYNLSLAAWNGPPALVGAPGVQYMSEQWCVYNADGGSEQSSSAIASIMSSTAVASSMSYACQNSDCTALGYGASCNPYLDAAGNVSYAFNSYFQRQNQGLGTCSFNGLGKVVTRDPSIQNCRFLVQIAAGAPSYYADSGVGTSSTTHYHHHHHHHHDLVSAPFIFVFFFTHALLLHHHHAT